LAHKKGIKDNKRKIVAAYDPKSPVSEQYRTIRTNIQFSSVDREIRSILVTSSAPAEGKSTTAANLAVVFAQQNRKVLLVDGDLRKPTVHYTFNLTNTFGLTSVLTRQIPLKEAVNGTSVPNLYVLTSGPIPPNPAELIGSHGMDQFLEDAMKVFDLVIFDTPPVLTVTDSQVLANKCDGTILVTYSGKTEVEHVLKAKESLLSAKGKLLGVILNGKKLQKSEQYYYYGK